MSTHPHGLLERFTPTVGRWLGITGLVLLAFVGWSVASTGFDAATVAILAALAFFAVLDWSALVRPSLVAFEDHLFVRNSWSDLHLPWHTITDVDVKQTLHLYTGAERHHSVAIGKSARNILREGNRPRGMASVMFGAQGLDDLSQQPTLTGSSVTGMHYADYVVLKLQTYVSLHRDAAGQDAQVRRTIAWPLVVLAALALIAFAVAVITART